MKIRDFLKIKDRAIITIKPEEVVEAAIRRLVVNNIGALPVCDENGQLMGIISERDVLRECIMRNIDIKSTLVQEVMTREVAVGHLDDNLDYVAAVMKKKRIRHLPIVTGQNLESIISMRDIVEQQLKEADAEIRYVGFTKKAPLGKPHLG